MNQDSRFLDHDLIANGIVDAELLRLEDDHRRFRRKIASLPRLKGTRKNFLRQAQRIRDATESIAVSPIRVLCTRRRQSLNRLILEPASDWHGTRGMIVSQFYGPFDEYRILGIRHHALVRIVRRLKVCDFRTFISELPLGWLQWASTLDARVGERFVVPLSGGHSAVGIWRHSATDRKPVPVISTVLKSQRYTALQNARHDRVAGALLDIEAPRVPALRAEQLTQPQLRTLSYWYEVGLRKPFRIT